MTSILSYPERGPWGDRNWRGNCSGHIYRELFEQLRPREFVDPMVGSGTSIDVARDMGIPAIGLDLHSGFDALTMSIAQRVGHLADLVVSHPPYGGMIRYSGHVWGESAHPNDLSWAVDDDDFLVKLQQVLLNQRDATEPGGVYGLIIGDWRRKDAYVSYQAEIIARMPRTELRSIQIKAQHNCASDTRRYGHMRFPLISHEYVLLWSRSRSITSSLGTLAVIAREQAVRIKATWRATVRNALVALGGKAALSAIYEQLAKQAPERLAQSRHWMAKVRQTVQIYPDFRQIDRGIWGLVGA